MRKNSGKPGKMFCTSEFVPFVPVNSQPIGLLYGNPGVRGISTVISGILWSQLQIIAKKKMT